MNVGGTSDHFSQLFPDDFLCLLHGNDEDAYFAFECKRLNVTFPCGRFDYLAADYVGPEGIGCFVSQKYASGQQHGGMIGYVFNGDIETARSAINNQLARSRRDLALLSDSLATCGLSPENSQLNETQHNINGTAMAIYHLLLPVV